MRAVRVPICVLFVHLLAAFVAAKENSVMFTIHPGGRGSVQVPLDTPPIEASTCTFDFVAFGATPEMWEGRIVANLDTRELECTVSRAGDQQTYLLFESFRLSIGSEGAEVLEVSVADNDGDLLEEDAFVQDDSAVRHKEGWSGSVRSVFVKSLNML